VPSTAEWYRSADPLGAGKDGRSGVQRIDASAYRPLSARRPIVTDTRAVAVASMTVMQTAARRASQAVLSVIRPASYHQRPSTVDEADEAHSER